MITDKQLQTLLGYILTLSVIASVTCIIIGAVIYLSQVGHQLVQPTQLQALPLDFAHLLHEIWQAHYSSLILLGLIILVVSQIIRVAILAIYYWLTKDYIFLAINSFILLVLMASLVS